MFPDNLPQQQEPVKAGGKKDALSQMIHDVRNPMHVVKGLAEILSISAPLTPRQEQAVEMLKSNLVLMFDRMEELFAYVRGVPAPDRSDAAVHGKNSVPPAPEKTNGKKRVLVVEDYAPNVIIAASCLQEMGYEYDIAASGKEALEKFSRRVYDAVLMDIQLEGGEDGIETAKKMREEEKEKGLPHVRIIAMTGNATDDDKMFCRKAGIDDLLPKPFEMNDLKARLVRGGH